MKTQINPKAFTKALSKLYPLAVCCPLIDWGYDEEPSREMVFFRRLFGHESTVIYDPWWDRKDTGVRVIALQLAACVAADDAL